jgi:N-acetylmuramoyl-L-alanine amidase
MMAENPKTAKPLDAAGVLAKTAWGEARGEKDPNSRLGVMHSVLNRQKGSKKKLTLWAIVNEPNQYSAWSQNDPNRDDITAFGPEHPEWPAYYDMANGALAGTIPDPTDGAEHYITKKLAMTNPPGWVSRLEQTKELGNHVFYRKPVKK